MSQPVRVIGHERSLAGSWTARARGWIELTKPRIAALVVLTAFVAALLSAGPRVELVRAVEAALWIGCVAASSAAFNQILERDTDALMRRTRSRPLVVGTIRVRDAVGFAAALGALGTTLLAWRFNAVAALLSLATLATYTLVYTPLKRASSLNTVVGAVAGAMPPLLGAIAVSGSATGWGVWLFAFLFAWQFPHFMAIAWLYREDYAAAGMKMLPALPHTGGLAGRQALLYSLSILPLCLLPASAAAAGPVWLWASLGLSLSYAVAAARFAWREDRFGARLLLFVSLVYLPALYTAALLDPIVSAAALSPSS